MGKITSSFTRGEKQIIGFVLGILIVGMGAKAWMDGKHEPVIIRTSEAHESAPVLANSLSADGRIKINEADAKALEEIPGVGPEFASDLVAHRAAHGPFRNANDLDAVDGIGPSKLAKMLPTIDFTTTVPLPSASPPLQSSGGPAAVPPAVYANALSGNGGGAVPVPVKPAQPVVARPIVNINTAGRAELDTLDGIGPALAARIMADRQANGPYRSVQDLARVKGIGPKVLQQNWARLRIQ